MLTPFCAASIATKLKNRAGAASVVDRAQVRYIIALDYDGCGSLVVIERYSYASARQGSAKLAVNIAVRGPMSLDDSRRYFCRV